MTRRRQRLNVGALVAFILAVLLALLGLRQLDVIPAPRRDALRLTSAPRALDTRSHGRMGHRWHSLRGDRLSTEEERVDRSALDASRYTVHVGIYPTSIYDLDLRIPSYSSNGYVWLRWQEPMQRYLDERGITMADRITLLNGLLSDAEPQLMPVRGTPERLDDGSYYQRFTYVGRFYIDRASYRQYPFMRVSLPLVIEADDVDGDLGYQYLRLLPEIRDSGIGLYTRIIGWLTDGWSIAEYRHHYGTNFGLGGPEADYSQVVFDISLGTSAWASFWRLFLPLAVLMAMVLLVFKIRPDEQDARATIPVTVLLTLVFLQQSYRAELPGLPFLTFLDQVYVIAYVVTLIAFVLVLWIGRRYGELESLEDRQARDLLEDRLHHLDEAWPVVVVISSSLLIGLAWLMIPSSL